MNLAFEQAAIASSLDEVPVGAVVVLGGEVIATAHNETAKAGMATRHAEIVAIERAAKALDNFRLSGATLYTTLEPCIMCAGASILSRLESIVYACPDVRHGACGSIHNLFEDRHPIHQVKVRFFDAQERSAQMLKQFFKKKRENGRSIRRDDRSTAKEIAQNCNSDPS